jgi:uncharacterized protein (UPF0548 family)
VTSARGRTSAGRVDRAARVWEALRWPVGMAIATARVLRRIDVIRTAETRRGADAGPVDRPVPGNPGDVQPPAIRRRYRLRVRDARLSPEELIGALAIDPNAASPFEVARFVKTSGRLGRMDPGDEYLVWMAGPWNGPVRVAGRTPRSVRLATLRGHMEAGEIEFSARREGDHLVVQIESAARSATVVSWLLFGPLRLGAEMQLHMWVHYLERCARLAGGVPAGPAEVATIRYPDDRGEPRGRASRRVRRALAGLSRRERNFTPEALAEHDAAAGWHVDHHCTALRGEPPGPPTPGGPWETAAAVLRDYQFPDPSLIRGHWDPGAPLEGRDMLLEGRFLGLRFMLGVRVVDVRDETTTLEGRPARVYGWSYATLRGHLEKGRLDYSVIKFCDTGEVWFRMHAVSRVARIANPLTRLGFAVFGRGLQLRFARTAGRRMARLVEERASV